jgi:3D (Asp-Asp-Asp) domain-containing protein
MHKRGSKGEWVKVVGAALCAFSVILAPALCSREGKERSLLVTATAYTSRKAETDDDPTIAAWGGKLKPGMKAIAVSHDLISAGLSKNTKVRIEGLEGHYVVMDKMNRRWKKRIDIYYGNDVKAAKKWGARKITIYWKK